MNKNTVKKLADNPHYTMSDKELEELANMLHEEFEAAQEEEKTQIKRVNKNRVPKTFVTLDKTGGLKEDEDVDSQ